MRSGNQMKNNSVVEQKARGIGKPVLVRPRDLHSRGGHMEQSSLQGHVATRPGAVES